jgi:YVTN family beta-propeller protein
MAMRATKPWYLTLIAALGGVLALTADTPRLNRPRRPVALALAPDGRWLYAANQRGSISVIDLDDNRIAAEVTVGRRLSDLVLAPGGRLLATDEDAHELVVLSCRGPAVAVTRRVTVAPYPVSVRVSADGARGFVASPWARQVSALDLAPHSRPAVVIPLPFAPRQLLPVRGDQTLLVADAFGGHLAVIDVGRGAVQAVHDLPGHNVRGLALSGDGERLLLAHQVLSEQTPTTRDDIHWGNLITNNLRVLRLAEVLAPGGDPLHGGALLHLGDVGTGAGDPAGVAVAPGGLVLTALGGVGDLAVGPESAPDERRLAVGRRPTAVLAAPDGRRAYVADTSSDAVAVVDLPGRTVVATVALGPAPDLRPEDRGERAFYDARLSHDGWLSCHSCHTDGHTTGRRNDNLGDGSYGAPKRILSLRGVRDTAPWAWNGGMTELEAQVRKSVLTTMHGRPQDDGVVRDLAAFLRTLPPPPSLAKLRGEVDEDRVGRGRAVFRDRGCADCHAPPAYTAAGAFDVGMADEVGHRRFNPPSLRGVGQGGPYFHDGRAATLDEVFTRHLHQLNGELTPGHLDDLLAFLRSL